MLLEAFGEPDQIDNSVQADKGRDPISECFGNMGRGR